MKTIRVEDLIALLSDADPIAPVVFHTEDGQTEPIVTVSWAYEDPDYTVTLSSRTLIGTGGGSA